MSEVSRGGIHRSLRDYLALLGGRLAASLFSLVGLSLTARLLGPDGYGQFALVVMAATILSTLVINWPNPAVIRFGREELERTNVIRVSFWSRLWLFLICGAVAAVLVIVFATPLASYLALDRRVAVVCGLALATGIYEMSVVTLQATDHIAASGRLLFGSKALVAAALVYLYAARPFAVSPAHVVVIQGLSAALISVWALAGIRRWLGSVTFDPRAIAQATGYTWAIILGAAGGTVVRWIDLAVIRHFLDLHAVGLYAVAYQITTFVSMITASISSVVFPAMVAYRSNDQVERIEAFVDSIIPQTMLLWNGALGVACIAVQVAIPAFFGEDYQGSILPLQVLFIGLGFNAIGRLYTGVTNALDLLKHVALMSILVGIINLCGNYILVPRIGILGAAFSTLAAFAIVHQSYIFLVNRSPHLPTRRGRYLVSAYPLIPAAVTATGTLQQGIPQVFALIFAFSLAVLLSRQLRLFTPRTFDWIQGAELPEWLKRPLSSAYTHLMTS